MLRSIRFPSLLWWSAISVVCLLTVGHGSVSAAVVISEFMASNNSTIVDEDGDSADWIELHNNGNTSVDISGWYLTDDDAELTLWPIVNLVLGAGEFKLVFASSKDRSSGELHSNFKLGAGGEYLALVEADGTTIASEYSPEYPQQYTDISYGLNSIGGSIGYFTEPTPGLNNGTSVDGLTEAPELDIEHGFYESPQLVTLSSDTENAQIRYTLDGSTPSGGQGCQPPANGDRVNFEYFEGNWNSLPDFDAITPITIGTSNAIDFSLRERDTNFGFRFTGCVFAPQAGQYRFFTASDDPSQLMIGDQLVVDNDGLQGGVDVEGSIFLSQGLHPLKVIAYHRTGNQALVVNWTPPAGADAKPDSIKITADNRFTLYVNGNEIGSNVNWTVASDYSVALKPGDIIAVEAQDLGGAAAMIADISANGRRYESSHEWKVSHTNAAGWTTIDFDDSGWAKATEYGNNGVGPWGNRVSGLPQDTTAQWIWGTDSQTIDLAFFRYVIPGGEKQTLKPAAWLSYTNPVVIDKTTTLRSIAVKTGFLDSEVTTATYLFASDVINQSRFGDAPAQWPAAAVNGQLFDYGMDPDIVDPNPQAVINALKTIPSISVVTDQSNLTDPNFGIYSNALNSGRDWEREASIELIDPTANEDGFSINGGIRIRGGFSRTGSNPKHALRLFFRGRYQGELDYPFYGADGTNSFEKLDLRTAQNYSWAFRGDERNTFLREVWSRDSLREMGHASTRSRYFHLYLNGVYWGLFMSQERISKEYAASYFGGDEDDYDVVKHDRGNNYRFDATDGLDLEWRKMHGYIADQQVNDVEYSAIEASVDLDNLIDLMLLNAYTGDLDGSPSYFLRDGSVRNVRGNNWYALHDRTGAGSKWRFFDHDSEHTFGARRIVDEVNRLGPFPPFDGQPNSFFNDLRYMHPYWLHEALTSHVDYRQRIIDRVDTHFKNSGVFTPTSALARWNERKSQVAGSIIAESARWGDSKRAQPFTVADWQSEVNWVESNIFPGRHLEVLQQLQARGLSTSLERPRTVISGNQITLTNPNGAGAMYYTVDGSDPRAAGGGISASAILAPNGLTLNFGATTIVRIRIWDGSEWSAPIEVQVEGNSAPEISDPGALSSSIGVSELVTISASDSDGDSLFYSASGLPAGLTIDSGNGDITGTTQTVGAFTPTINVSDGQLVSSISVIWTVYPRSRIILNEYNAVSGSKWLGGGDDSSPIPADTALGRIIGNGGDWFELLVIEDQLDLRGWILDVFDDGALDTTLTLSNDPALSSLPAGTVITIIENPVITENGTTIGEDGDVDPANDDWSITLVAGDNGTGQFITATDFKVSNDSWQLVIKDTAANVTYGPVGEGVAGFSGVGSEEVGKLEQDPSPLVQPGSDYNDGTSSTFGSENLYADGTLRQDFSALRDGANVAPVIAPISDIVVDEGDVISLQVQATDANNDTLSYSAMGAPAGVGIDSSSGLIEGTATVGSAGVYTITVTVDDGIVSSSESFKLTINDPLNGGGILNVSDMAVNETDGVVEATITLSTPSSVPVQVGIHSRNGTATGGQDFYGFTVNPVTFSPGDTTATASFTVIDDGDIEGAETLSLRLFNPVGAEIGNQIATITIVDDDAPVSAELSIDDISVSEGSSVAQLTVSLSQPTPGSVSVGVHTQQQTARGGQDFYGFSTQLNFAAGQTTQTVDVVIIDDQVAESTETLRLRLYDPIGATIADQSATLTIIDDDGLVTPTLSMLDTSVSESNGEATITVSLSAAAVQPVSVTIHTRAGTARGGEDFYGFTRLLNFPTGVQNVDVTVTLVDNQISEPTESLQVRLLGASGAVIGTETATINIVDDD